MEQYIKKSALVAEIERRIKTNKECMLGLRNLDYYQGKVDALNDTLSSLDTLQIKEVDLEKEIKEEYLRRRCYSGRDNMLVILNEPQFNAIAKHFFELGLKTQHSSINIPNIDDVFEENDIDPNSKDAKIFKECYYMALEKLKAQKGE